MIRHLIFAIAIAASLPTTAIGKEPRIPIAVMRSPVHDDLTDSAMDIASATHGTIFVLSTVESAEIVVHIINRDVVYTGFRHMPVMLRVTTRVRFVDSGQEFIVTGQDSLAWRVAAKNAVKKLEDVTKKNPELIMANRATR